MIKINRKRYISFILAGFLFLLLGNFSPVNAGASLYLAASATTIHQGNTFIIYPRVNTGGAATNAYSLNMTFTSGLIQPISMSKGGSICSLYTQEPSYTASTASISCGLPSPGYNGTSGGLGSITFRAVSQGTATITINSSSQVLANDGSGTNILDSTGSITIYITEPPPPPIESPNITASVGSDNEWTSTNDITFSWTTPDGASGFSYKLTQDQNESAGKSNLGGDTSKTYTDLADGTYYFKIAATDGSRWSNETTYTLLIDTTPPENLEIISEPSNDTIIDELPLISFNATDATSGVDHYEIKIDDGEFAQITSPYQFESITSGEHTIIVKAVDKAGNTAESSITIKIIDIEPPTITKPSTKLRPIGDSLLIEGYATPNSIVYIYLNGELIAEVQTDENGYFSFLYDKFLPPGDYEIYAIVKLEGGLMSEKSVLVEFSVDPYAVKLREDLVVPSYCIFITFLIIVILLIILIIKTYRRFKRYSKKVETEFDRAQKLIDHEFDTLRKDTKQEIDNSIPDGETVNKTKLSQIEKNLNKELSEEIQEAQEDIENVIEEIPIERKENIFKKTLAKIKSIFKRNKK